MAQKKHPTRGDGRAPAGPIDDDQAWKRRVLLRAEALSKKSEVFRSLDVTQLICETVAYGLPAEAEIFQAAYGDPSGREYWNSLLSEPIPVVSLAYTLSVHLAESVDRLDYFKFAILCAFRDAAEAGERWFTGDTTTLLSVEDFSDNVEGLGKLKVEPRATVEWLQTKPKREHLVPQSLRGFLQASEMQPRTVNEKTALRFVQDYIDSEQAAGRRPSIAGVEAAGIKAGKYGAREHLRAAFRQLRGAEVRRGRPPKALTKIAEK